MNDQNQPIRFTGNVEDGYTAWQGAVSCRVFRVAGGWSASYEGSALANPVVHTLEGASRSCMSPVKRLEDPPFKSRGLAAEAGLQAAREFCPLFLDRTRGHLVLRPGAQAVVHLDDPGDLDPSGARAALYHAVLDGRCRVPRHVARSLRLDSANPLVAKP